MVGENEFRIRLQECIVYLDSYKKVDDGVVDAYVDFRTERDLYRFSRILGVPDSKATYIELLALKTSKRLIQGCYYKLNLKLLQAFDCVKKKNSLLIGWVFDLSNMAVPKGNPEEVLQRHEPLDPEEMSMLNVPGDEAFSIDARDDWELFVKNVGQANWNELRSGEKVEVVYDAGAELNASPAEVDRIFNSRKPALERSKPVLVLSHWDKDHIHCLKNLSHQDISNCFSKLICVDKLKTITASRILKSFISSLGKQSVFCLPIPLRTNGIDMHQWRRCGSVVFYQGEQSRNINFCGLVMFINGLNASANLTGDCKLLQANNAYQKEINRGINTNRHILVAPHHGGDYGAAFRVYTDPCNTLISVGAGNGYGHPQADMLVYLISMGPVERTDWDGDIIKRL